MSEAVPFMIKHIDEFREEVAQLGSDLRQRNAFRIKIAKEATDYLFVGFGSVR